MRNELVKQDNPSTIVYVLTGLGAAIAIALCFGLFQAVLTTLVGRVVMSLALAIVVTLPFVSVVQDAVVAYNKERDERRARTCK